MGRPIHFEIEATDVNRAQRFYETVFGWNFQKAGDFPYWLITTGPDGETGINGGLGARQGPEPGPDVPVNAFTCVVAVDDLDETVTTAIGAGATVITERHAVAGVGYLAYLRDTEGNRVGLLQADASAT